MSLRDLDWRFLLPWPADGAFQRLVLLGGTDDLAHRIVEVGLARQVSQTLSEGRLADALIILHPARVTAAAMADCLAPGGVFYYETRPPDGAPGSRWGQRLFASLQEVGLAPDGLFWVRPDFARRQAYIPMTTSAALAWYLGALFTPTTTAQRWLVAALPALGRYASASLGIMARCWAVTGRLGSFPNTRPPLFRHPALPMAWRGVDVQPLLLVGGTDTNRVALFPFARESRQPLAVLKGGRQSDRNQAIEHEQMALDQIRGQLDEAMRQTLPRPLGIFPWGDLLFGVESYAPGRLLAASTHGLGSSIGRQIADLRLVADWLTRFNHQARRSQSAWGDAEMAEWVDKPLRAYEQAFGVTANEARLFLAVRHWATGMLGAPLSLVWTHWGFEQRNIFRQGRVIHVVDWEGASPGLPLYDLLYFVTRWSDTAHGRHDTSEQAQGFRELFLDPDEHNATVQAARAVIEQYMTDLVIDPRYLPLCLVMMWVERALGRVQLRAGLEPGMDARRGNGYIDMVGLLAEHQDHLWRAAGRLW